jgi:Ca2+-transporting ATPase
MAFLTMSLAEIFQSFNMRSQRGSLFMLKKNNKWLLGAAALALVLTTVVIEIPFLAKAFEFVSIGWEEYAIAFSLGLSIIPLVEIVKFFQRLFAKKK